jgi:Tfp pilus assembly major pilin PilA
MTTERLEIDTRRRKHQVLHRCSDKRPLDRRRYRRLSSAAGPGGPRMARASVLVALALGEPVNISDRKCLCIAKSSRECRASRTSLTRCLITRKTATCTRTEITRSEVGAMRPIVNTKPTNTIRSTSEILRSGGATCSADCVAAMQSVEWASLDLGGCQNRGARSSLGSRVATCPANSLLKNRRTCFRRRVTSRRTA